MCNKGWKWRGLTSITNIVLFPPTPWFILLIKTDSRWHKEQEIDSTIINHTMKYMQELGLEWELRRGSFVRVYVRLRSPRLRFLMIDSTLHQAHSEVETSHTISHRWPRAPKWSQITICPPAINNWTWISTCPCSGLWFLESYLNPPCKHKLQVIHQIPNTSKPQTH